MALNIDPTQGPITTGMPAQKKKKAGLTDKAGAGPQVFDLTDNGNDPTQLGLRTVENDRGIGAVIDLDQIKRMYNGNPELIGLVDRYMNHLTGEKSFGQAGVGARFGVIGQLARRLPPPILWDAPDLVSLLGQTMCVDSVGRCFIYAGFLERLLKEEACKKLGVLPILTHEYVHVFADHPNRMKNINHAVANCAQDKVINPMVKRMFPAGTVFADVFANAHGNCTEDEKYLNLSEETIAKMMLAEMAAKGTIKIGTLTIVDGPVTGQVTHTAAEGEVLDLGDITVTVEDKGMSDVLDTLFDCGTMVIDKIDNRLKPRNRPSPPGTGGFPEDKPIMIPNIDPNNLLEGLSESGGTPGGHMIDEKKLMQGLNERGYGHVVGDLKLGESDPKALERLVETAMSEAGRERSRIGQQYPGAHIEDYYKEVVKPSRDYTITWDRRVKEFITGTGPVMARSIDEPGIINMIDAADMNMTEDDRVYMAGLLPQKPEDKMFMIVDTSGSVDRARLAQFIALAVSMRQSADDMAPEIIIIGADTVARGNPQELDDDTLADIAENGYEFGGRGGTDVIAPLNQIMKWAKDNNITIAGILYATDLGIFDMEQSKLPEDLPPLMFLAIPEDYKACAQFVDSVKDVAEVVVIEKEMELNFDLAEERSVNRGQGIAMK